MNMRQSIMLCTLALLLIATLGATAAQDVEPGNSRGQDRVWLKPAVSDRLLASRLNITNIPKTPLAR